MSKADADAGLEVVFGGARGDIQLVGEDDSSDGYNNSRGINLTHFILLTNVICQLRRITSYRYAGLDQQLLETLRRRQELISNLPVEAQKRRLIGWLARRGHSWSVSASLLAELGLMRS